MRNLSFFPIVSLPFTGRELYAFTPDSHYISNSYRLCNSMVVKSKNLSEIHFDTIVG